uniref:Uncharacterized protein n=1 Tax=Meloidogyne hapla TaxID=6305 RepID=A0A1I8BVY1_MELHA
MLALIFTFLFSSFGSYGPIPSFNPHIPPPIYPPTIRSTNTSPNDFQPINANNNVAVPPSKSPPTTNSSAANNKKRIAENNNVANKVVKQEVEEVPANAEDDIPSFQSPPDIVNGNKIIKTTEEFSEDERNKQKQALLWSLCQEELTVQSSIANGAKKVESIRKKIDTYHHALSNEEMKLQELKLKAEQLAERRKELLMSAGDGFV